MLTLYVIVSFVFLCYAIAGVVAVVGAINVSIKIVKQRKGLHSKAVDKGMFIFTRSRNLL